MGKLVRYLAGRRRTHLDVTGAFGLGYVLGAHALGTWWGKAILLASVMGVTDMAATALRRLAR
jgi:hypothetical protein